MAIYECKVINNITCPAGATGPPGPIGATGPAGPPGPTGGAFGTFADLASYQVQTLDYGQKVRYTPGRLFSNNFTFNGTDTLTVQQTGTYYLIGTLMPSSTTNGPVGVAIAINDNITNPFGAYGANYGGAAGQEVTAFALLNLTAGNTISLNNISPFTINIGGNISGVAPSSRLVVIRIF